MEQFRILANGCWEWTGVVGADGYGTIAEGTRNLGTRRIFGAHRLMYEVMVGPIPKGLCVDHVCHNEDPSCKGGACRHRRCVNPDHLRLATMRENILAGRSPSAVNARARECIRGHPLMDENLRTGTDSKGRVVRACRECARVGARARYAQKVARLIRPYRRTIRVRSENSP